jgi:GNAT superfamily N-acetyltransferase
MEFGQIIPWLEGLDDLRFVTNGETFRGKLLRQTGQEDGLITPYQFLDSANDQVFAGGVLHFAVSPERLTDPCHIAAVEKLTALGYSFISCLQVRAPFRCRGVGRQMTSRALQAIVREKGPVWGVISDARLIRFYRSLGAYIPSPVQNKDGLWIASFDESSLRRPLVT